MNASYFGSFGSFRLSCDKAKEIRDTMREINERRDRSKKALHEEVLKMQEFITETDLKIAISRRIADGIDVEAI